MWSRVTWAQFTRAAKFFVGLGWGTLELWQWGGRPGPLLFIASVIGVTEAGQLYERLRQAEDGPAQ